MNAIITKLSKVAIASKKKYPEEIEDIILFGSLVKGKSEPKDIDILIIFKEKVIKEIEYSFRQLLPDKASVISKTKKTLFDASFDAREGVLFEGYSLIDLDYVGSRYGFQSWGLFLYETKGISNNTKTRFYYALNGRGDQKGISKKFRCIKLSDRAILVPLEQIEPMKEFFNYWNIEYKPIPSLIPSRLSREDIIAKS